MAVSLSMSVCREKRRAADLSAAVPDFWREIAAQLFRACAWKAASNGVFVTLPV